MRNLELSEIHEKKLWEDFVQIHPQGSFLQSWNWGELHKNLGNEVIRLGVLNQGKLTSGVEIFVRWAKRGSFIAVPAGPLINWENSLEVESYFLAIAKIAKEKKVWFVRMRPNATNQVLGEEIFKKYGYIKAPMPLHAEDVWVLNLEASEEELLANMRKSTRYEIKRGAKGAIDIIQSQSPSDLDILYHLQAQTAKRKGFKAFEEKFLQELVKVFSPDNQVKLFFAKQQEKILSAALIIFYPPSAFYYVGASTEDKKLPSSQFLLWQAILQAKQKGLRFFNFMGITPKEAKNHPWSKVTFFKEGFGGARIDYLTTHDLPLRPFYWLTYLFETWQRRQRRI